MKTSRPLASLAVLAALAVPAPASAAGPDRQGLRPVHNVLRPVDRDDPRWVGLGWTTDREVCHVRVRVRGGRDVEVAYPGGRRYTSFTRGEGLRPGEADYTSFRVTAHQQGPDRKFLTATVDYDYCRRDSPTMNDAIGFWLPVRA